MTLTTINERIANAEARLTKKQNTITKKTSLIERKTASLTKLNENDRRWTEYEIGYLKEDIERLGKEVENLTKTLESYRNQLVGAEAEESLYINEVPTIMKKLESELIETWDAYDKDRKARLLAEYKEDYKLWHKRHKSADYEFMWTPIDKIHEDNVKAAKVLVLDLYKRVKNITGEVTNWDGITADIGNEGFTVLNGIVQGKNGKCRVESILAGGYNIQRLHIRVLTHEIN